MDMLPQTTEATCEVSIGAEVVTAPCMVIYVTGRDGTAGVSFRIEQYGVVIDSRFFGNLDPAGLTVTHFATDTTKSPIPLVRSGRCNLRIGEMTCRISGMTVRAW